MMRQYQAVKAEIPDDAVLLFRLGDFYEMFFADAERASPILDVVLTKRGGVPMCGIPFHALESYLPRLIEAGVKVAIAEQVEDPRLTKGIVKREVTRIITPGTVIDGSVLAPGQNNFLVAITGGVKGFGLARLDISTGEFKATSLANIGELETELHRLNARECAIPESLLAQWEAESAMPYSANKILWTPLPDWIFDLEQAEDLLKRHFAAGSLDGFGLRGRPLCVSAAGAVLHYAKENLRQDASHVKLLSTYDNIDFMGLDPISQRNLELVETMRGGRDGTLLSVLDETVTPMGGRMLRDWISRPLFKRGDILARLDSVEAFINDQLTLAELTEMLGAVRDLERITARVNVGNASARDLASLAKGLEVIPDLKTVMADFHIPLLRDLRGGLCECRELVEEINRAIVDEPPNTVTEGGIIRPGYNDELDELRAAATEGKSWLAAIQRREQERTGIKSLKVRFNKVFGYYIEVSKSNLALVPEDFVRKQTLANAERFITPELKEVESKILGAEDKSKALELEIFHGVREVALEHTGEIQRTAAAIAAIDALASLAECARRNRYVRPHISEDRKLEIKDGRHPVLDANMAAERFIPNDALLDGDENRMMIITGPNMAGKSTYIRQTAMIVIMAQMGSFVPADYAEIGLVDRVFTRVGAADDISRGQSTFMVEMVETANILNHATGKSLVILDEIGRGTSTFDGLSIAWAVAEHLHDIPRCRTQFATHYHELTELSITREGVKNYNVAVKEYGEQIIFLRRIVAGGTDKSYGIHVAKLAGLPDGVVARAKEILENLEDNALADAGQPALARHADDDASPEPFQPTLF